MKKINHKKFALLVFVFFFLIEFFTLFHYGTNWDEPNHYVQGQAYLRYFLFGKEDYKDLPKLKFHYPKTVYFKLPESIQYKDDKVFRRSLYQIDYDKGDEYTYKYYMRQDNSGHPPVNDIVAAFFNFVFYQRLGILGDVESYHLFIILISSILVSMVFLFTAQKFGIFSGFITALALCAYPLFFAESHFNIKDPISASFYTLTLLAFYKGVTKNKYKWILLSAVLGGFALGSKLNIVFVAITIVIWLLIYKWRQLRSFTWPFSKKITISLFVSPLIALGILFIFWPFLWQDPIAKFTLMLKFYQEIGARTYQPNTFLTFGGFNTYPLQLVLYTTPIITLFLSAIGIFYTFKRGLKDKDKTALFVFLWFIVPILRVSMPNAGIYGGARQIMEYIPAMAILSGIGAFYLVRLLQAHIAKNKKLPKRIAIRSVLLAQMLLILLFLPIIFKLISIHPNENVYFNPLIGGLKGAKEKNFPDWGVTLGSVYMQGIDWINKNAEKEANVALVKGLLSNFPRIKMRQDINSHENYYSGEKKSGEYLIEVVDYHWIDIPEEKRNYINTLKPVYEVKVDGVSILSIWKNDLNHTK